MLYVTKKIYNRKYAVINTVSGLLHSSWDTLAEAKQVAYDLNKR